MAEIRSDELARCPRNAVVTKQGRHEWITDGPFILSSCDLTGTAETEKR